MNQYFIDANVIADYLLLKIAIQKAHISEKEYLKQLLERGKKSVYSFVSIEAIMRGKEIPDSKFFTSNLAISEVSSVLYNNAKMRIMFEKGIPPRYWCKPTFDVAVPKDYLNRIKKELLSFCVEYRYHTPIEVTDSICNDTAINLIVSENDEYCHVQDACLLSQAILKKNDFFVTSDTRLKDKMKNNKQIKIITSETLYHELKRIKKNTGIELITV